MKTADLAVHCKMNFYRSLSFKVAFKFCWNTWMERNDESCIRCSRNRENDIRRLGWILLAMWLAMIIYMTKVSYSALLTN